ncbi:MAG: Glycosyl transferase group 1 [Candidatus Woesebacteria bacterium GW2011_GWA1_39_21]|uniref:Glycosyl transferase group 1 n=1 Tax=Candidatus Woesebacteria bacterium GW2011_GWA1_39_21 TaxID=1618550 RepID=A0A0G0RB62_9BACT|nr:MAG: Glycosyl transferase group 1 [Candidatus Woesebacteria bacterium GW2011_GWA1_39_21]
MKVFAEADRDDFAILRIVNALKKYAPKRVKFVESESDADLVILYVYGFRRHTRYHTERLLKSGKKYAIVQLCLRSTPNPVTTDWNEIWESAQVVWSYYDLKKLCQEDHNQVKFNFYYAPLGVDAKIFKETPVRHKFLIASTGSGNRYSRECKYEVIEAADELAKNVFQLGFGGRGHRIAYSNGMSDELLAGYYSSCDFVSGLHRIEGFEFPVLEGLLCGARPICFDLPCYRAWFDGIAEFIPDDFNIVENLYKLFIKGPRPVTEKEKAIVKKCFNWQKICKGFWSKALL